LNDAIVELEKRLGRLHARLRLGVEADHEAQVFGQGINYFHFENLPWSHTIIRNRERKVVLESVNDTAVKSLPLTHSGGDKLCECSPYPVGRFGGGSGQ
jgi:hypothetical protein